MFALVTRLKHELNWPRCSLIAPKQWTDVHRDSLTHYTTRTSTVAHISVVQALYTASGKKTNVRHVSLQRNTPDQVRDTYGLAHLGSIQG